MEENKNKSQNVRSRSKENMYLKSKIDGFIPTKKNQERLAKSNKLEHILADVNNIIRFENQF